MTEYKVGDRVRITKYPDLPPGRIEVIQPTPPGHRRTYLVRHDPSDKFPGRQCYNWFDSEIAPEADPVTSRRFNDTRVYIGAIMIMLLLELGALWLVWVWWRP